MEHISSFCNEFMQMSVEPPIPSRYRIPVRPIFHRVTLLPKMKFLLHERDATIYPDGQYCVPSNRMRLCTVAKHAPLFSDQSPTETSSKSSRALRTKDLKQHAGFQHHLRSRKAKGFSDRHFCYRSLGSPSLDTLPR